MTPKQKRTAVLAGIIGTLFACYDDDEQTRLHKELHSRIGVGTRKMVKQFGESEVVQVIHTEGNAIWKDAVGHFAEQEITIEASSCVLALCSLDEKALFKQFGMSKAKLSKWASPSRRSDAVELEKSSMEVARYVFAKVSELYGLEVVRKVSVLEQIALARMSA